MCDAVKRKKAPYLQLLLRCSAAASTHAVPCTFASSPAAAATKQKSDQQQQLQLPLFWMHPQNIVAKAYAASHETIHKQFKVLPFCSSRKRQRMQKSPGMLTKPARLSGSKRYVLIASDDQLSLQRV
jgi:hypothetical protein